MNYFDQVADRQLSGAQRAKERGRQRVEERKAESLRPLTDLEKKRRDGAILMKAYRAWRAEVKAAILARHGANFAALVKILRAMPWTRRGELVDHVRRATWLKNEDEQTRLATLSYIDQALVLSRVRYGLAPFDDGFLGEEADAFIIIRQELQGY